MRLKITEDQIVVTLSKRNLLALLHKVDQDWSAKTIGGVPMTDGGPILFVRVEPDEQHYAGRPAPPGEMHPDTEEFIRRSAHPKARIALRRDSDGRLAQVGEQLDDVVINEVYMFRAEMMDDDHLWMSCYLKNTGENRYPDALVFDVSIAEGKKKQLQFVVTELPEGKDIVYEDVSD